MEACTSIDSTSISRSLCWIASAGFICLLGEFLDRYKLEPHRTMHLRGFDRYGAAAAMHSASATGFSVTGVFRDPADFAVLIVYDADDCDGTYVAHPRWRYLPSFDFTGVVLQFDVAYDAGLMPLDSSKYPSIAWPYLSYITDIGTPGTIPLFTHATQAGGTYTAASAVFTLNGTPATYDRVTLWYQNFAFDYIVNPGDTAATVLASIAAQINSTTDLAASVVGTALTVTARKAGVEGNMIQMYELHKNSNLYFTPAGSTYLTGGSSAATWQITLDFSALTIPSIRQMWFTLAPRLAIGAAYAATEFSAVFSNWSITADPDGNRPLKVAGAGSVTVGSRDSWTSYGGSGWAEEAGFYYLGFAHHTATSGDGVTITYHSQHTHDLYLGTSLYSDRAIVSVSLDGDAATTLDCYLNAEPAVVTRRVLRTAVAAGKHTLVITHTGTKNAASSAYNFYFDYLTAAVASDVPDAPAVYSNRSVATDLDTDSTYKVSPARLVWEIQRSGLVGDIDHYVGVFWWAQRVRSGGVFPAAIVTFGGTWASGDTAFMTISGTTIGKSVFPADTVATIAAHFAVFINETFVGVWASAAAGVLTITCSSPENTFTFTLTPAFTSALGTMTSTGDLATGAAEGNWNIDPTVTPVVNRAMRDWHADYFATLVAAGMTCTVAFSMELVNPPDNPPSSVWAQRFPDGTTAVTATGLGTLYSTQCTFNATFRAYQQEAYIEIAGLMVTAGLVPWLQFGEFLWWFNANASGMAYWDHDTAAAAVVALGRPLHTFLTPADNPAANLADANFLQGLLAAHIATVRAAVLAAQPTAKFEILWPLDVDELPDRQLNQWVNLPVGFETKAGSGLDRWKMEALSYGSSARDLDKAQGAVIFPCTPPMNWSKSDVIYLIPWFNGGCPWEEEFLIGEREQIAGLSFWAWDQLSLLSWPLPLPVEASASKTSVAG